MLVKHYQVGDRIIAVRGRYYLARCPKCGWVGSSEDCSDDSGPWDDGDVICPECFHSDCDEIDAPRAATPSQD